MSKLRIALFLKPLTYCTIYGAQKGLFRLAEHGPMGFKRTGRAKLARVRSAAAIITFSEIVEDRLVSSFE